MSYPFKFWLNIINNSNSWKWPAIQNFLGYIISTWRRARPKRNGWTKIWILRTISTTVSKKISGNATPTKCANYTNYKNHRLRIKDANCSFRFSRIIVLLIWEEWLHPKIKLSQKLFSFILVKWGRFLGW